MYYYHTQIHYKYYKIKLKKKPYNWIVWKAEAFSSSDPKQAMMEAINGLKTKSFNSFKLFNFNNCSIVV